jgi:hypothetical protein
VAELVRDEAKLSAILDEYDAQEKRAQPAPAANGDHQARCAICAKDLTAGQVALSTARFAGRLLCPIHQKQEQPVAA